MKGLAELAFSKQSFVPQGGEGGVEEVWRRRGKGDVEEVWRRRGGGGGAQGGGVTGLKTKSLAFL